MEYCDRIGAALVSTLKELHGDPVGFFNIQTKLDLDPDGGFLLSTDKVITCQDNKGTKYKITIQAKPVPSMEQILADLNIKHSLNGDPLSHYLDSITTKLVFAQQDRSVLAEISPAELEVLQVEIDAARAAQANPIGAF
jgi:hypothetical protein